MKRLLPFVLFVASVLSASAAVPPLAEALASGRDVWGEAAMAQPNGASYEFFAPLLPPPRYVHADFRHYPIVLSAPNAKVKARLIANGSGVNLRGGSRSWHDIGTPVTFRVGPDEFLFGGLRERVTEPELAEGWLPIVQLRYTHRSPVQSGGLVPLDQPKHEPPREIYRLEAFAATDPALASNGVVFVKFDLAQGTNGFLAVEVDGKAANKFSAGRLTDAQGRVVAVFDSAWKWERGLAVARLRPGTTATLEIPTASLDAGALFKMTPALYAQHREAAAQTWKKLVAQAMNVETPEPLVNNAWRHLLCQNFSLITGDRIHYSAGNQYDQLYEAEGSDTALAMLWWGYENDMRRLAGPLIDFTRKGLEFHQAGFKINDVCRLYWQTRDAAAVKELRPRWEKELRRLVDNRTGPDGLFPKEQYCGDIHTFCYSLNANSKAWRAIRDMSTVLAELGEKEEAKRYADVATDFRKATLAAVAKSVRRETTPPFVPVALFGDEPVHDPILHSRIGSYWNIIIGYTMASGIFPRGSEEENWIARYQEQHGGLCMGMIRSGGGEFTFWTSDQRVNPLYGTRYALDTLRRDDPERALVSFYGMLAQGFTRNTFVTGEGCALTPVDDGGRFFYCPPNSAGNAHFLTMLRHLLVQDSDLDDDGEPETLRLGFGTSRRWLEDGKQIKIERAPTAFGPVSAKWESKLSSGEVLAQVELPARNAPKKILLRARVPEGWRVTSAEAAGRTLAVDEHGTVDLTGRTGTVAVRFKVAK
ncbi:MAG: hypothetical protein HY301_10640 [Verrucomicrobia bacterium]|nr:hypothetical protein [Verrucomicrobiota bacterium]